MSNSYRFDHRNKSQFASDIKNASINEAIIAVRYCIFLYEANKTWSSLVPTGVDFTGKFIEDSKEITSYPDFSVDGIPTEITRADTICKEVFHQKTNKIRKCIENGYNLIFVNGFKLRKEPKFIILNAKEIKKYTKLADGLYGNVRHPGNGRSGLLHKLAYRYDIDWFDWKSLPVLINDIPQEYSKLLGEVCQKK
jgi:hypothetical protein